MSEVQSNYKFKIITKANYEILTITDVDYTIDSRIQENLGYGEYKIIESDK